MEVDENVSSLIWSSCNNSHPTQNFKYCGRQFEHTLKFREESLLAGSQGSLWQSQQLFVAHWVIVRRLLYGENSSVTNMLKLYFTSISHIFFLKLSSTTIIKSEFHSCCIIYIGGSRFHIITLM